MWAIVVCIAGCGDIKEVPVDDSGASSGTDSATGMLGGETYDRDTDPPPLPPEDTTTDDGASTTDPPAEIPSVCAAPASAAFDPDGVAEVVLEVAGHGTLVDLEVGVRITAEDIGTMELRLVRNDTELVLKSAGEAAGCGQLDAFFDADAETSAAEACAVDVAPGETLRLAPVDELSGLFGASADGTWTLRATVPAGTRGLIDGVCLAFPGG
jgi:hypothetical protein